MRHELEEVELLGDLLGETPDVELESEFYQRASALRKLMEKRQLTLLMNEEYDESDAILTIHPGAGGMDSADWAEMLHRMYLRWAEIEGFQTTVLDFSPDIEAGLKSATVLVKGPYAYGYLKAERGVHRLVRISPFDAAKRRHTSFASLDVAPELPEDAVVEIRAEDLKMDTFRASGAGGQYVNMTDSAVRITHVPTGLVVTCQDERSQLKNRVKAMQLLRARLYDQELQRQQAEMAAERKGQVGTGDRSERIRTYNFPQNRLTDHRIGFTLYKLDQVLDGDLYELVEALTMAEQAEKLKTLAP